MRFGGIIVVFGVLTCALFACSNAAASGWYLERSFGEQSTNSEYVEPYDVTAAPDGTMYVVDMKHHRIVHAAADGSTLEVIGSPGSGPGQLLMPRRLDIAPDGTLWVADEANHRIVHFTASGTFIGQFGSKGASPGELDNPNGVAVAPDGTLVVADMYNSRIQRFDADGTFVDAWGSFGAGPGQFSYPAGVDVAPDGTVYVADLYNNRVQYFQADGTPLGTWGSTGSAPGQFSEPRDVEVLASGDVAVVDRNNSRVQVFTSAGVFVRTFGTDGFALGELNNNFGVTEAADGTFLVADTFGNRVCRFDAVGTAIECFGAQQASAASLRTAWGLAVSPDEQVVYVAQDTGNRVSAFDRSTGTLRGSIGGSGYGPGSFLQATGLAVDTNGSLLVGDRMNHRIQRVSGIDSGSPTPTPFAGASFPYGLAVAPNGDVWASTDNTDALRRFASDGSDLGTVAVAGTAIGDVGGVQDVAFAADGTAYVTEFGTARVQEFASDGTAIREFATFQPSATPGQLLTGIDVAPDGKVHVASPGDEAVLMFAPDGSSLGRIERPLGIDAWAPGDVVALSDGTVIVSDMLHSRVDQLRYDGTAPALTASATHTLTTVTITASAADTQTGLPAEAYSFDGGVNYQASPIFERAGLAPGTPVTVDVVARDVVGNVSTPVRVVEIANWDDITPPSIVPTRSARAWNQGAVARLRFSDDQSGLADVTATTGGRSIPISADGVLDLRQLRDGRHRVVVVARDRAGNAATWVRVVLIDRTPPTLRAKGVRHVMGGSATFATADATSGAVTRSVRVSGLRLGPQTRRVRVRDRAGNSAMRTVRVVRHVSLARPWLNRGLAIEQQGGAVRSDMQAAFRFLDYSAPWYATTDLTPSVVREVQWRLSRIEPASSLRSTGVMDVPTIRAVQRFQARAGLPRLGTVGPRTRRALDAWLIRSAAQ